MRILIATDAFPPVSGGSGWSTYELARGLRARGHDLIVVQPYSENAPASYDGFNVVGFHAPAPHVPFVRNYFRNERLYRRLSKFLAAIIEKHRIELVHAQHELTGPAAIRAAESASVPSVCTIRDYWPLCYWNDLVRDPPSGKICPACSVHGMTECLPPRAGGAWPVAPVFIPYMRANLRRKRHDLARADALVAVSESVAKYLRDRAPELGGVRIEAIPNGVDVQKMRSFVRASARPLEQRYALFVRKLAHNKGAGVLVDIVARAKLGMPLVIIGDGPERRHVLEDATRAGVDVKLLDWLDREEVFRWLGHASFLIFPSGWPEPLSRVLLEASALGVPIAAMNTGGTSDIVVDGETGLLSSSPADLSNDVARLASDEALRVRLGSAAAKRAESLFDMPIVLDRMERLYRELAV